MDTPIASDVDRLIPLGTSTEVNKSLTEINEKIKQLKTIGLTRGDYNILEKDRLKFVWAESEEPDQERSKEASKLTIWRHSRARRLYTEVQDASDELFLAFILAITPTKCAQISFEKVVDHLNALGNYEPYRLALGPKEKRFFESTSVEQGFIGNHYYLHFMKSVFPQRELRQIKFAYGLVPRDLMGPFTEEIVKGIFESVQWKREALLGARGSGTATIFVPTAEADDGGCNFIISRKVLVNAIKKFGLSDLMLE